MCGILLSLIKNLFDQSQSKLTFKSKVIEVMRMSQWNYYPAKYKFKFFHWLEDLFVFMMKALALLDQNNTMFECLVKVTIIVAIIYNSIF